MAQDALRCVLARPLGKVHIVEEGCTREDILQYSCRLTLDPNTVNRKLRLSEGYREATRVEETQPYPDHPERFDYWEQVLCREGLSGRCYWEAEWRGEGGVHITMSYKDISRKGEGDEIGVYLDHRAGTLSFYSVSDTMTLLHRVQTTFTQPLYAGFGFNYPVASVKLEDQLVAKTPDVDSEGCWFKPQCSHKKIGAAVGPLSKALNPHCSQGGMAPGYSQINCKSLWIKASAK
ncbi:hypothetical protein JZ751_023841 [Albula glossodonta]|uniref:SPRY-associated domain-containing protein n=1 Tax=Albula glossodonta TaxID=121402 RepID=A0A8T2MQ93_9TELE|nr:hypothetical protein JZ751_023841 [Albula glossodonta]